MFTHPTTLHCSPLSLRPCPLQFGTFFPPLVSTSLPLFLTWLFCHGAFLSLMCRPASWKIFFTSFHLGSFFCSLTGSAVTSVVWAPGHQLCEDHNLPRAVRDFCAKVSRKRQESSLLGPSVITQYTAGVVLGSGAVTDSGEASEGPESARGFRAACL